MNGAGNAPIATAPTTSTQPADSGLIVTRVVTAMVGAIVALTFLFGFGNVLTLALRLGVPVWVAPPVAPSVDLSILGLLLSTRHLALHGATRAQLRPARQLLIFASLVTLALNVADPIVTGAYGRAAFDAVGPLLLIGWAEVGPGVLRDMVTITRPPTHQHETRTVNVGADHRFLRPAVVGPGGAEHPAAATDRSEPVVVERDLIEQARRENAHHWAVHQRPISAETLRRNLRIGSARSRALISMIRTERHAPSERPLYPARQAEVG